MQKQKYIIIGAGPIGLLIAICIKAVNPHANIKIFEKYPEYKRAHTLKISLKSLNSLPLEAKIKSQLIEAILQKGKLQRNFWLGTSINIRTNDLEEILKDKIQELELNITYNAITDFTTLQDYTTIIGADGARSKTRAFIYKDDDIDTERETLEYLVQVKYEATHNNGSLHLKQFGEKYRTQKLLHFFADELVGKVNSEGKYPVSLQFFTHAEIYKSLGKMNYNSPKKIQDINHFPDALKEDIKTYLEVRMRNGENVDPKSLVITQIPLEIYHSKIFARQDNKQSFYIAGDAGGGVPYFRALNAGIERIAYLLEAIKKQDPNLYSRKMLAACRKEERIAKYKYI